MTRDPKPTWPRRLLDAGQYAVALTAVAVAVSGVFSLLLGGGLLGVKYGLFLAGFLHLGYATLLAWWGSRASGLSNNGILARFGSNDDGLTNLPGTDGSGDERELRQETTGFQQFVGRFPPVAWYPIRPRDRLGDAGRLFIASATMWFVSIVMETVFGVAAV
ncbi:MAG: hypothetical protein ABEI99_11910 [Halobaculum sp.]